MIRQSTSIRAVSETLVKDTSEQKRLDRLHRLRQLRQILAHHFNEGELRTLCFDLGIDYDDLPGDERAGKARELVSYLKRYGRISELVEIGTAMRPDISWSDVPKEVSIPKTPSSEGSQELIASIKEVSFIKRCLPLRVFISSTFKDLKDERQAVKRTVHFCGCTPLLAEEASMQPRRGIVNQIAYWLRDADLLILIVCARHGESRPSRLSWTEEEVKKAVELEKLIFPYFLMREIPASIEVNEQQKKRVKEFKSWLTNLENQQPPQYVDNVQELVIRVARDIGALQSDYRANAIMDEVVSRVRTRVEKEGQERRDSYEDSFMD